MLHGYIYIFKQTKLLLRWERENERGHLALFNYATDKFLIKQEILQTMDLRSGINLRFQFIIGKSTAVATLQINHIYINLWILQKQKENT